MRLSLKGHGAKVFLGVAAPAIVSLISLAFVQAQSTEKAPPSDARSPEEGGPRQELIYVPIYSSIYYETSRHTLEMAATLSIHNVNPDRPITIVRADYFDTTGKLIKKYVDKPLMLGALATTNVVIDKADKSGGTGANFLVEWRSDAAVSSPLVEAVMVNATSNLGIAFTTTGRVIRQPAGPAR